MKFKESHRQDIVNIIDTHGLDKAAFSFVKRKGRILIKHESGSTFSFFIKEDFDIDIKTMNRIDLSYFEVKIDIEDIVKVKKWESVLKRIQEWLSDK